MHDIKLEIAVGRTVRSKVWKNTKITWSEFVAKLSEPTVTSETLREYANASREERGRIKDVGGYVGGYLRGQRRKPENVTGRQLITLDLDFAHLDVWEDFTMMIENAAVLHSTHSHTKKNPKYRLIMPIDREVSADEYVAIGRRIAGYIGIEYFDNTGFQPYRLMFWPSISKDADYKFHTQDGAILSADDILNTYRDWRDTSQYPVAAGHESQVVKEIAKQQNPLEKSGIVGAFCRTYSITEGIEEYLQDKYTPTESPDRYTFTGGSTSKGLVVYNDLFAYSHHGTDPAGGKLSNIFDLIRLQKFGHFDDGIRPGTTKTPSYKAMETLCLSDRRVKAVIAREKLTDLRYDFAEDADQNTTETDSDPEDINVEWATELDVDNRGNYLSTAQNLNIILANDPRLKGRFRYDLFCNKRYLYESAPWRIIERPEPIKNVDFSGLRNYLETVYGIVSTSKIEDALALEFNRQAYHPVRDYLSALEWDGVGRVDHLLKKYFGVSENIYTREAMRVMLVGAVARIFDPGCKFDLVLVLVGEQGDGKSTFINRLGGVWFSDSFSTFSGKEAFEQLQGAWLIEMAELSGMRKADIEAVKHFITKREDTYRPAYSRTVETFPRQSVFFATTNEPGFLADPTGNRRFMPVDTDMEKAEKSIRSLNTEEIAQIWAEAKTLYEKGAALYLSPKAELIAGREQRAHRVGDQRLGLIHKYLDTELPEDWDTLDIFERLNYLSEDTPKDGTVIREFVCAAEVWAECLGKNVRDIDRYKTKDVNALLKTVEGWKASKSTKKFPIYGTQRYYYREF